MDKQEGKFKKITLVLTQKCMLSCDYCEAPKSNFSMSRDILEKTFVLLSNFYKEKYISVKFFGGEPLIEFPLIKRAISICKKLDDIQRYDFSIFTNGVLLNKIDLKFLAENNIRLLISIDGDSKTTSTHRKGMGINPYNNIINVLPKLKSLGIRFDAEVTVSPYTVNKLSNNYIHLVNLGFQFIDLVPVLCTTNSRFKWTLSTLRIFKEELNKIGKIYLKFKNYYSLGNLWIYCKQSKEGLGFIELSDREITVDTDGGIYIGDSFLLLDKRQRKKFKVRDIQKIKSSKILEKLYKKYIDNKKFFLSCILKNPFVIKCSKHPTVKILNEEMGRINKLLDTYEKRAN